MTRADIRIGRSAATVSEQLEARLRALCRARATPLGAAVEHHFAAGGGRARARVALTAGERLGLGAAARLDLAAAVELLHNASLVHDDLQDRDPQRRGAPAVWRRHGEDAALLTGDLMLSAAYAALASAPHPGALIGQVHARLADTVAGQARDLSEAHDCRDLNTWEAIAAGKSAPFFALALELPLLAAGEAAALTPAGRAARHFALAYQIRDDLEDAARDARCGRLNAAGVLARAGESDPRAVLASRIGSHLGAARRYAARLPRGAGEALLPVIDAFAAGALEPA